MQVQPASSTIEFMQKVTGLDPHLQQCVSL
jgi:hypothetical protein